ncbi:zinc-dependent alcohol dehydrogenase family protein [Pseudomonas veronii]|nr:MULTISPECIES: NAD(P)-dependent alcohol dehydrogenase [Pseudomonas]SEC19264.1 NADPH:quinone reductase [Pseudomonas marginalis]KRP69522.1 alcohol dehydrogenase [Pseudomonas veronii]OPK03725.1 NAD(P)-dependent alcohol dehydrogenase [Pseudomonas veronii]QPO20178.1 NAD(P)-dependent alcohol dehydrogenase [Pseudomonas sp. Y39-6]UHH00113.1 NAD(P)-dependent alcohol dehydrogenase [Pseudomonas sp. 7-41]
MNAETKQNRAYHLEKFGGLDGLVNGAIAIPTPASGEVVVRVRASSLNFRDILILQGHYTAPVPSGTIPLSDGAGEVIAVGEGVTRFVTGDRVVNSFFPEWIDGPFTGKYSQYSYDVDGWLADYRVTSENALAHIPGSLSFEEAATLPCAAVTAWSAVKGVSAGDTVLTQGTGGVSLFAIQFAKALGARVIATTSSDEKSEQLKLLGVADIINYKTHPAWSQQVRALTNGNGVNRIVEVGGSGTFQESVKAIAVGGQVSMVGVLAGLEGSVDFMSMFMSQARYQPIALGSRQDLEDLIAGIAAHGISPVIDSRFEFGDAKRAYEKLMTRDVFGKVVISH